MADYIPEEIITSILHRLPVNSLLRCTAVCKSWHALITATHFITSHSKSSPPLLLSRRITNSERYDLYSDDSKSLTHHSTFQFPFTAVNSHFTIVGSCNGLLCLSDDRVFYTDTIVLWNPSIRKSLILPKPTAIYNSHGSFVQSLGFGFDSASNDYKVVRITYLDLITTPQIEIYRLSSGKWREKIHSDLDSVIYNRSRHVYVNGASHWIAREMNSNDLILSFDLNREVFGKIKLPIPAGAENDVVLVKNMELMVFRDSLALAVWNVEQSLCVWVMEECWSRRFDFDLVDIVERRLIFRPVWIRENGEVVVVLQDGRLVSCGRGGGEVVEFGGGEAGSDECTRALHVCGYASSLVLVERSCLRNVVTCKNLRIDYS